MTYKEIINRIRTVAQDHLMIKDFGYGELSDIKTQAQLGPDGNIDDGKEADYPYMFLLQSNATRNDPVVNYNFSMIMMDMARGEEGDTYDNYLTIQSQCQQYIDDVLANLYYFYRDQPMVQLTGITYTPFKEKYQDEVAGMTCNFTIEVPNGLNDCVAPFALIEHWRSDGVWYISNGVDANGNEAPITIPQSDNNGDIRVNKLVSTAGYWDPNELGGIGSFNQKAEDDGLTTRKWTVEFDMTYTWMGVPFANQDPQSFNYVEPLSIFGAPNSQPPAGRFWIVPDVTVGWPGLNAVLGQKYSVKLEWNSIDGNPIELQRNTRLALYPNQYLPENPDPNARPLNDNYINQVKIENVNMKVYV